MVMDAGCSPPSSLEPLLVVAVMEATRPVDPVVLDPASDLVILFLFFDFDWLVLDGFVLGMLFMLFWLQ